MATKNPPPPDDGRPPPTDWYEPIDVAPEVLARYRATVLDPATVARVLEQPPVYSTVYVTDELLIDDELHSAHAVNINQFVADNLHLSLVPRDTRPAAPKDQPAPAPEAAPPAADRSPGDPSGGARRRGRARSGTVHRLVPIDGRSPTPDAWAVLQAYRAQVSRGNPKEFFATPDDTGVGLNHLLTAGKSKYRTTPFLTNAQVATASYGQPGWGGVSPVVWVGGPPARNPAMTKDTRPVVAVLDSGCGEHEWFPPGTEDSYDPATVVIRNPTVDGTSTGRRIGLPDPLRPGDLTGITSDPLIGTLDPDAGHGTFIAGVIHQICPDANILSVRVMPTSGAVPESVLIDALNGIIERAKLAEQDESLRVDVVSLSLGFYHEKGGAIDPLLQHALKTLGELGVMIVAAAGNDSVNRPMYPAGLFPHSSGPIKAFAADALPVISVGAQNPNGTVALFSNDGPWVAQWRPGAAVVSTFPQTFNGSMQSAYSLKVHGRVHSTIDGDDLTGGFGTWSGTSFSAPALAGDLANALLAPDSAVSLTDTAVPGPLQRPWTAIKTVCGYEP